MAHLKALRPHISADGVYRAVGESYHDENPEHVKQRVHYGIVETVEAEVKSKSKSKTKDEDKTEAVDKQPAGDSTGAQPTGTDPAGLIED